MNTNDRGIGVKGALIDPYLPKRILRNGTIQTLLSRAQSADDLLVNQGAQPILLDGGADATGMDPAGTVRLLAYYTAHKSSGPRRGLVMTIHGWEGCSHSSYNLVVGSALVRAGYDVLRLNLRDHGPTHRLNRGLFYVTLLAEVLAATRQVAALAGENPFYILGASLGGNFALRLALAHAAEPIPGLVGLLAINPVLNPSRSSDLLDSHAWIRLYFRGRWLASLRAKQKLFPDSYDFAPVEKIPSIRAMTEWMLQHYSPYPDAESYFAAYAIPPDRLRQLTVPVTIVTAADDPIIPADDFYRLPSHPLLRVRVLASGGHVGYTDLFPLRHFLAPMALEILGSFS
ncbi:MAG: alpha/beta fold hydrolase [Chloroflexi bacterium]|nr:MAG: alpha/beta fold hydrolase [Chloroflexota bacterium]